MVNPQLTISQRILHQPIPVGQQGIQKYIFGASYPFHSPQTYLKRKVTLPLSKDFEEFCRASLLKSLTLNLTWGKWVANI